MRPRLRFIIGIVLAWLLAGSPAHAQIRVNGQDINGVPAGGSSGQCLQRSGSSALVWGDCGGSLPQGLDTTDSPTFAGQQVGSPLAPDPRTGDPVGAAFLQVSTTPLGQASDPVVTTAGMAGSTTYGYTLRGISAIGGLSATSNEVTIDTGNATLSGSNYNIITVPSQSGYVSYAVFRATGGAGLGAGTGYLGTVAPGGNLHDTGLDAGGTIRSGDAPWDQSSGTRLTPYTRMIFGTEEGTPYSYLSDVRGQWQIGGFSTEGLGSSYVGFFLNPADNSDFYSQSIFQDVGDGHSIFWQTYAYVNEMRDWAELDINASGFTISTQAGTAVVVGLDDSVTFPQLAGTGVQFACLDAAGQLVRSATACGM